MAQYLASVFPRHLPHLPGFQDLDLNFPRKTVTEVLQNTENPNQAFHDAAVNLIETAAVLWCIAGPRLRFDMFKCIIARKSCFEKLELLRQLPNKNRQCKTLLSAVRAILDRSLQGGTFDSGGYIQDDSRVDFDARSTAARVTLRELEKFFILSVLVRQSGNPVMPCVKCWQPSVKAEYALCRECLYRLEKEDEYVVQTVDQWRTKARREFSMVPAYYGIGTGELDRFAAEVELDQVDREGWLIEWMKYDW